MSRDFKKCIEKKSLYKSTSTKGLFKKELTSAEDDLGEAKLSLSEGRLKWATIQAYYAMFHAARALLYSSGYRERSHHCVVVGVEYLFAGEGLLDIKWARALRNAMIMREEADYGSVFSVDGAKTTVSNAEGFLKEAKRILDSGGE
jgi:uncharacterized protein (UPF0332 family)